MGISALVAMNGSIVFVLAKDNLEFGYDAVVQGTGFWGESSTDPIDNGVSLRGLSHR